MALSAQEVGQLVNDDGHSATLGHVVTDVKSNASWNSEPVKKNEWSRILYNSDLVIEDDLFDMLRGVVAQQSNVGAENSRVVGDLPESPCFGTS